MSLKVFASKECLEFLAKLVGLACLLGLAIDLVTANVAVEYFTVHHPRVIASQSPWAMAFLWGISASWWAGLIAGVLLWWVNARRSEPLSAKRLLQMAQPAFAAIWVVMMGILASVYGIGGLVPLAQRGPTFEHGRRLMAVAMAHSAEYVLAGIAAVILAVRIARFDKNAVNL